MTFAAFAHALHRQFASLRPRRADWRQCARVMIGAAAAFGLYEAIDLPQGYWAVFTVVIVMQGSVGGTLGASTDRLMGTTAGAVIGGVAASLHPPTRLGLGVGLILAIGASTLLSSIRPRLKVAPVTAAIMLLSANGRLSPLMTVLYRVIEIGAGGAIGVVAAWLILPSPALKLVAGRAHDVLDGLADLMDRQAAAIRDRTPFIDGGAHVRLRAQLSAVEAAMTDAEREHSSRLAHQVISEAVPRTLWRVRNDVVLAGRALTMPLPDPAVDVLGEPACAFLTDLSAAARAAGGALERGETVAHGLADANAAAFQDALARLRREGSMRDMAFDAVGRVFGLAFALESLRSDLNDLVDRVDESAAGDASRRRKRSHPTA